MSWKDYIELNKTIKLKHNNIDFNKALAHNLLFISFKAYTSKNISYFTILTSFMKSKNFNQLELALKNKKIIFTTWAERADYIELIDAVKEQLENQILLKISDIKPKLKINFHNIYKAFIACKATFNTNIDFKLKLFIVSQLCYNLNIETELKKLLTKFNMNFQAKSYVAFNSSFGLESLICQVFNQYSNIQTFSLSHGLSYVNYSIYKPLDYINGYNITAQKVIVWGESSKQDLIKNYDISSDRILIGGNPKYPIKYINLKQTFKHCIVLLPRGIYDDSNILLLQLLKECLKTHPFSVTVKLHPNLDRNKYIPIVNENGFKLSDESNTLLQELISNNYDFAIAYNTTAYYESFYYSIPCFRFGINENEQFIGLDDLFTSSNELIERIESYKKIDNGKLNNQVSRILKKTIGFGVNKYSTFLN